MAAVEQERAEGNTIYPPSNLVYRALELTAPEDVKVIILGQDPYHGPNEANGLAFSVTEGVKYPPSLRNIFKELEDDIGVKRESSELDDWARQGVLLLNTTLTVREHEANSHAKLGWKVLTDYLVRRCCELPQPVVFLAWGAHAIKMVRATMEATGTDAPGSNKFCLASTHPSPLSATRAARDVPAFIGSRPFSHANKLLVEAGAKPIDWADAG